MSERLLTNPEDIRLVRNWTAETRMRSIRSILFGSAAVVAAAGLGVAAIVWSANQGVDPEALKQALADMPALKVEPVKLDPAAKVILAEGGKVGIEDGAKIGVEGDVGIEPGSTVKVDGGVPQPQARPVKTEDGEIIRQKVVTYHVVAYQGAEIHTGWEHASGASKAVQHAFCYWTMQNGDGSSRRIDLGTNGQPYAVSRRLVRDFDAAFSKCVWPTKGGA
jgi:hypothetical protein